ncbi:MAG: replication-associated recombination protein A, partial [Anaerolineae bacterium]|nr:replication-associated recombination protein A [Anaerolineae bacterium]
WEALKYLEEHGYAPPPAYLRDQKTLLRDERDNIPAYKYPHDYPDGWVAQRYLPEGIPGGWYRPKGYGYEQRIVEFLSKRKPNK